MFDLEDVRAYVAVAETGGFGRAGARLGLSKSMVSRRVVRLEQELGAQLFNRTTRGVVLTDAGATFKTHAERAIAELETGRDAVGNDAELSGALRIAAPLTFGAVHLAPVFAEFAMQHDKLQLFTAYSDRHVDLVAERFDAAIRLGTLPDSSLVARRIAPMHGAVIASPKYLGRHGTPQTPADLAHHELLIERTRTWRFRSGSREIAVPVQGRFETDSGEAALAACIAGAGIALLPTFLSGPHLASGAVVPLLRDYPIPEFGMHIVRPPPASHVPRKLRLLTDLLVQKFGGEQYWDVCYMHRKDVARGK